MQTSGLKPNDETKEHIETFFLDSGAHSLYTKEVIKQKGKVSKADKWKFYESKKFWRYVDEYAEFIKANKVGIDYYANVDVIFNPDLSWKVLKYLEKTHKLNPVPVIHFGTSMDWVRKHLSAGYEFLGIGGLGQEATAKAYRSWADELFSLLCPGPSRLPTVRTHGFAMTSWKLMQRYPWWSVDSASWIKMAAFGSLLIPHKRNGQYTFDVNPHIITVSLSVKLKNRKTTGNHMLKHTAEERKIINGWLEEINIPYGKVNEEGEMVELGVCSHYGPRRVANLLAFQKMADSLPEWPWPFAKPQQRSRFF